MKKLWATFLLGLHFFRVQARQALFSLLRLFSLAPKQDARFETNFGGDGLAVMPLAVTNALPALSGCIRCGLCEAACARATGDTAFRGPSLLFSTHSRGLNELTYARELRERVERCTACEACLSACPRGLSIPAVLALMKSMERAQNPTPRD